MDEKELDYIIKKAFTAGESWGVTYSTWFVPNTKTTEKEIESITKRIKRHLIKKRGK